MSEPRDTNLSLTVTPARLRRFLRSGLAARVTCATGCRATFRLRVLSAGRRLPAVLAQATRSGDRTAVLKPSRATRRALASATKLAITVQADVSTPAGTVRLRRTLTLR